jgi:hypothetical protein
MTTTKSNRYFVHEYDADTTTTNGNGFIRLELHHGIVSLSPLSPPTRINLQLLVRCSLEDELSTKKSARKFVEMELSMYFYRYSNDCNDRRNYQIISSSAATNSTVQYLPVSLSLCVTYIFLLHVGIDGREGSNTFKDRTDGS